ncbi:ribonuclease domain-containing protein [Ornithinimicrobium sp. CNJ-824]|uniref:ribonuclease domain-containing protein n=1 Tax=Ornithinimicrobium sp. CNJ-824 TaxID=1904966 RepID=UPI000AE3B09A|nr:ribonuclease domain-containing protein [Ornithinimicrobium sp. CNJ-824]
MRLSRPVAAVLLVLVVLLLVWLMLGQGGAGEDPGADAPRPSPTAQAQDADPAEDPVEGPTPEVPDDTAADDGFAPFDPDAEGGSTDGTGGEEPRGVDTRDWDGIDACRDDELPVELDEVADDVEAGGPFDYPGKDGSTFGNYEGYLPEESRGYYREYTVETPGLDHRGARRIVAGGGTTDPEVWYYTDDHYESFCEFAP